MIDLRIPHGEILWESYYYNGTLRYIVTSKQARDYYFLYAIEDGTLRKVGRAKTPVELREKYISMGE